MSDDLFDVTQRPERGRRVRPDPAIVERELFIVLDQTAIELDDVGILDGDTLFRQGFR